MKYKPFPEFEKIDFEELKKKPVSIILQAGSNWLTKWGERKMKWEYDVTFTHAMIYIANGDVLSMGSSAAIHRIEDLYRPSQRFIIISFTDMSDAVMRRAIQIAYNRAGSEKYKFKTYDWRGYLGFLTRVFPPLKKIKWLKGSSKKEFCSDQVVEVLDESKYKPFIGLDGNDYSPCDLFTLCSKQPGAYFNELVENKS